MSISNESNVYRLVAAVSGKSAAQAIFAQLTLDPLLAGESGKEVSRAAFAMALNALLFADLLERVPSGARYVEHALAKGGTVCFDHGALRTIRFAEGSTGEMPGGIDAFSRFLEPLGYEDAALYPLPKLGMTGHAFRHRDYPEAIPQFFVSELHVDQFHFEGAARRVFGTSRDPLDGATKQVLADFSASGAVDFDRAAAALPVIAGAFGRQHDLPTLADYEALLAQSGEAAWIATEGNAFNHATDRVANVDALADELKAAGWDMKPAVEVSKSGRVRQTALRADPVERRFIAEDGSEVLRTVPGSFYEFITRDVDAETGKLDLAFDSGNATGIFGMTKAV